MQKLTFKALTMKRLNILYFVVVGVVIFLLQLNTQYAKRPLTFFGFAETKETQINMSHPVEVEKIHVISGQEVKKGQVLLEVSYVNIDKKLEQSDFSIAELSAKEKLWAADIRGKIRQLEAEKQGLIKDIQAKIVALKTKDDLNAMLLKDLKSVSVANANASNALKIEQLEAELTNAIQPFDVEIATLQQELKTTQNPYRIQMERIRSEQEYFKAEQEELTIVAPSDGLIGNIHVKNEENLSSFATLITFYEENPTQVNGFIHESLILKVELGDSLEVVSSLHPEHRCIGKVVGLGSRIVEIPSRLRKMPDLKTYGREVLIEIPSDNYFLQKEKVVLNIITEEDGTSVLSLF